jgi:hypothetical protein
VQIVDLEKERLLATTDLPFTPRNAIVHGGRMFVAGTAGLACLDLDGNLLWSAIQPASSTLLSFDFGLRASDVDGKELWNVDMRVSSTSAGFCIGDAISQPDIQH